MCFYLCTLVFMFAMWWRYLYSIVLHNSTQDVSILVPFRIRASEVQSVRLCDHDAVAVIQVWQIRVDVHTLNNDGNLMDAASVAAISALCHFRRPDVGIQGEEVTVVSRPSLLRRDFKCQVMSSQYEGSFFFLSVCSIVQRKETPFL